MGMTHGNEETYPRLADGDRLLRARTRRGWREKIVTVQRDFGDRTNRKHARFKYTIDDHGLGLVPRRAGKYLGYEISAPPAPFTFEDNGDRYGWVEDANGNWFLTLFIQGGRVLDTPGYPADDRPARIAKIHEGDFRLTATRTSSSPTSRRQEEGGIEELLGRIRHR
jgi:sulfite reductase (NADPH) hemoprotein beta-component